MINNRSWTDWLSQDPSIVPQSAEDFALTDAAMVQVNGRYLYLKRVRDLADIGVAEARLLDALARTGDTVFIAIADDPSQLRLSYRLPNVDTAVASDADGLRGLIRQWFAWASAAAA
jgi:hypothetical protein